MRKPSSHLVILGHPSPDSFNAAVANRYAETVRANYQEALVRDLYALGFNPLLNESERKPGEADVAPADIHAELDLVAKSDVLCFVYPLWFGMPPAMIKGYIDRIFGAGFRQDSLRTAREGHLRHKRLVVLTTSASTLPWLEEQGMWISLRQSFDLYLKTIFGFSHSDHYHADLIVDDLSPDDAERIFFEVDEFARKICADEAMAHRNPS